MIKGHCFTNIDEAKNERWPKEFVALPRVGDSVEARSGRVLKVVEVTHTMITVRDHEEAGDLGVDYSPIITHEPRIKIELHKG
jgi:hypothetical protein